MSLVSDKGFSSPLSYSLPTSARSEQIRRRNLGWTFEHQLDRVNVLGDNATHGHTGCVNALSWASHGELLLSGGDDTTVRVWRMDTSHTEQQYPFVCESVINTAHRANIFNAHMLPQSSRIVTAAGDHEIRVFDIRQTAAVDSRVVGYNSRQYCTHILRCHKDRVKRIVLEDSADVFLSVGEDGAVRQHDLRTPHNCRRGPCPAPLVKVNHELSSLSLSPLTPYQFVVAGDSPYGYLFDRRHASRFLEEEWGRVVLRNDITQCVRRFGRKAGKPSRRDHITGTRMSAWNGHEVLLSYSGDDVYLYSTHDEPEEVRNSGSSNILSSNAKSQTTGIRGPEGFQSIPIPEGHFATIVDEEVDEEDHWSLGHVSDTEDEYREALTLGDLGATNERLGSPRVPVILPRRAFTGARNVRTVKDVNFLGPSDEFVTSGSDDGYFFIWRKSTGSLQGIYEGDSSITNVVEGHPSLPLVAVSGIDTTVKLFAPTKGPSQFSRTDNAAEIRASRVASPAGTVSIDRFLLLAHARAVMEAGRVDQEQCTNQ